MQKLIMLTLALLLLVLLAPRVGCAGEDGWSQFEGGDEGAAQTAETAPQEGPAEAPAAAPPEKTAAEEGPARTPAAEGATASGASGTAGVDSELPKSYVAARPMLRRGEFEIAHPLLMVALKEVPDSIEVLAASAFCAEKLNRVEEAGGYQKRILRLGLTETNLSETEQKRAAKARDWLAARDPVSAVLYEEALRFSKAAHALGQQDEDGVLGRKSMHLLDEALGPEPERRRELLARRGFERARELLAVGEYEAARARLRRIDVRELDHELARRIEALGRLLKHTMEAEAAFRSSGVAWNQYVTFSKENPADLEGRKARLWAIHKQVRDLGYPRLERVKRLVREEIGALQDEQAEADRK